MIAPRPYIRWTSKGPDHDATYASAAKLRGGGPDLKSGILSQKDRRDHRHLGSFSAVSASLPKSPFV